MGAINRVATEMNAGGVTMGGGLGIEGAKHVDQIPSVDLMLVDWIFWTDSATLTTGGVIAFTGFFIILHGAYRGRRDRKRREEKENWIDTIVK
jgi:hypothetical protein